MAEIKDFPQAHLVIEGLSSVDVISVRDVRNIASGSASIAEFEDPERVARALACLALGVIDDD
jgi:hypothetical protein